MDIRVNEQYELNAVYDEDASTDVVTYSITDISNVTNNHNNNNYECQNVNIISTNNRISPPLTEIAAQEMKILLDNWGFSFLYEIFIDERIDETALRYMTIGHLLSSSISKIGLGYIIKFEQKLKSWQSSLKITTDCQEIGNSTIATIEVSNEARVEQTNVKLNQILSENLRGLSIINHYKEKNTLNDGCRAILLDIINSFLIQNKIKMSIMLEKSVSFQIIDNFPTEELGTYVKQQGKRAISKIYAKYFNSLRTMKDCGLMEKRCHALSNLNSKFLRNVLGLEIEPETDIDHNLECLRDVNCSFGELEHHWFTTKKYRCKQLTEMMKMKQSCTNDVLEKWPHYKKTLGYKLVSIDFEFLYGANEFITKFENTRNKLVSVMQGRIKDTVHKGLLDIVTTNNCFSENAKNACLLHLLHVILPPVSREMADAPSSSKQTCLKYSIKDSQNSIFLIGDTVAEIEEKIQLKIKLNIPIQPFIIVHGNIEKSTDYIVYFDGCRYKFNCILLALDTCFKIYMVFNLQYPQPSILIWNFIQKFFFGITSDFDKEHTSINLLIKKLKDQ